MGPILNDYGVMGIFNSRTRPHVKCAFKTAGIWWLTLCIASITFASWLAHSPVSLSRHLGNKGKVGWVFAWLQADSNAAAGYSNHCVRCTVVDWFNCEWRVTEWFVKCRVHSHMKSMRTWFTCPGTVMAMQMQLWTSTAEDIRCTGHQTGLFLWTCFVHYVSVGHFLVYMCHQNADRYKQLRNRKKL